MTDVPPSGTMPPQGAAPIAAPHPAFPAVRLLYALFFGVIAWFVMWVIFAIAIIQFIVLAITGKLNDELKAFTGNLVQYAFELLAFITFARDDQPFPMGPFPRHH